MMICNVRRQQKETGDESTWANSDSAPNEVKQYIVLVIQEKSIDQTNYQNTIFSTVPFSFDMKFPHGMAIQDLPLAWPQGRFLINVDGPGIDSLAMRVAQ